MPTAGRKEAVGLSDGLAREATMNTYAIRSALISALGVALALASGSAWAIAFRLTDLGTLGGTSSQGVAINASGQATGTSITADGETHAFLWDGTTMLDLGTLQGRPIARARYGAKAIGRRLPANVRPCTGA